MGGATRCRPLIGHFVQQQANKGDTSLTSNLTNAFSSVFCIWSVFVCVCPVKLITRQTKKQSLRHSEKCSRTQKRSNVPQTASAHLPPPGFQTEGLQKWNTRCDLFIHTEWIFLEILTSHQTLNLKKTRRFIKQTGHHSGLTNELGQLDRTPFEKWNEWLTWWKTEQLASGNKSTLCSFYKSWTIQKLYITVTLE